MSKKVAFVLDHKLHDYRLPVFNGLSLFFDVTVIHRGPVTKKNVKFKEVVLTYSKFGPFEYIRGFESSSFEVVVFMQNLRIINLYTNLRYPGKKIMWGIGTSSANGLGKERLPSKWIRNFIALFYDSIALYSSYPLSNYWSVNRQKAIVLGNTVESTLARDSSEDAKEYILFIGSLDKRKGLLDLLHSFSRCLSFDKSLRLVIVGDGPERDAVRAEIDSLGINDSVEMLGRVVCGSMKAQIFSKAYFVVSPYQAGLSVVEAFSFGVPYITHKDAITGGESLSIRNEENGVLFGNISDLPGVMLSFFNGARDHRKMGASAYRYYSENLTLEKYIQRFSNIINNS